MEAEHNSNHHSKPKKWKEHLLEFLMLFLAVSMGFYADNYRDELTDKLKVKQAMESLVKCLASDTNQLNTMIISNYLVATYLDSLIQLKDSNLTTIENKRKFNEYGIVFFQDWYFKTNDAAMQQLKSSSLLRLVKNQNIIDKIFGYDLKNKTTIAQEADCYFVWKEALVDFKKVVDLTIIRDTSIASYTFADHFFLIQYERAKQLVVVNDREKLNTVFSNAALMATSVEAYAQFMKEQRDYGIDLIELLKKEYQLKQ